MNKSPLLLIFTVLLLVSCSSNVKILQANSGVDALDRMVDYDTKTRSLPVDIITLTFNINQDLKLLETRDFIQKYHQKVVLIKNLEIDSKEVVENGIIQVIGGKSDSSTGFTFLFHPEREKEAAKLEKGKVVNIKGYVFSRSKGPYSLYGAAVTK